MPTAYRRGRSQAAGLPEVPGVTFRERPKPGMTGKYGSEDEAFLFGPTERPDEPVTAGATARFAPAPDTLKAIMPGLLAAAALPDAPPELHAFIRLLRAHQEA
jgi:hypothetical protein